MSGVLRRGSLNFDCVGSSRGSLDANLYGGYRESKPAPGTPEISVIAMDFRRHSDDLKKVGLIGPTPSANSMSHNDRDLSQDVDSDVLSNYLGHYRKWSFLWTFLLCLLQIPTTFHIFIFTFQVSLRLLFAIGSPNIDTVDCDARTLSKIEKKTIKFSFQFSFARSLCLFSVFEGRFSSPSVIAYAVVSFDGESSPSESRFDAVICS